MRTLAEVQAAFRVGLLANDEAPIAGEIVEDGLTPAGRLQVYRHHVLSTLTAVLQATYPVVCRLVDERFFAYAADHFIRVHPPEGPCLSEYGNRFPDFLAGFPACRPLPYLADVARLEWAMNVAHHAEDVSPLDASALRAIPTGALGRLVLGLDPSLSLLESSWPVDRIWAANQTDHLPEAIVDLGGGGARLEIRRRGDVVGFRGLDPGPFALRRALRAGLPLDEAAAAALAADAGMDLVTALHALLDEDLVTSVRASP